jgi:hypothetical protein
MASGFINRVGHQIDVEIHIAESPNDAATADATFANNIVANTEVNVFTRKMFQLPTAPDNGWNHIQFMPFAAPFPYTGQAHIAIRVIVWGNSNNNQLFSYPLDAHSTSGTPPGTATYVGTGGRHANGTANTTLFATIQGPGGNCQFRSYLYVPTVLVPNILVLGVSDTAWGAVPLPFDLTALGAPGNNLYIDWVATFSGVTSGVGSTNIAYVDIPVPNDPTLVGAQFKAQGFFADAAANALGFLATRYANCTLGGVYTTPRATRIYASGNPNATSGTIGRNYGLAFGLN